MAFQQKPGFGALFVNTRKKQPNHPDYTGTINFDGVEIEVAGWKKKDKNGGTFLSLSVKESRGGLAQIGGRDEDEPF